jgi:hypothetical protein
MALLEAGLMQALVAEMLDPAGIVCQMLTRLVLLAAAQPSSAVI